ncbi:hypothetical protein JKP88DRAFT_254427 [Tribonema minus]|uniref:Uncharacterized protein n=1 Tax=Tribonema minus TaxID=303371 RepID=A0A836CIE7_9STRA|nr:hypothetical protein JKP88DRAFT_254427 [Tribonema minus]
MLFLPLLRLPACCGPVGELLLENWSGRALDEQEAAHVLHLLDALLREVSTSTSTAAAVAHVAAFLASACARAPAAMAVLSGDHAPALLQSKVAAHRKLALVSAAALDAPERCCLGRVRRGVSADALLSAFVNCRKWLAAPHGPPQMSRCLLLQRALAWCFTSYDMLKDTFLMIIRFPPPGYPVTDCKSDVPAEQIVRAAYQYISNALLCACADGCAVAAAATDDGFDGGADGHCCSDQAAVAACVLHAAQCDRDATLRCAAMEMACGMPACKALSCLRPLLQDPAAHGIPQALARAAAEHCCIAMRAASAGARLLGLAKEILLLDTVPMDARALLACCGAADAAARAAAAAVLHAELALPPRVDGSSAAAKKPRGVELLVELCCCPDSLMPLLRDALQSMSSQCADQLMDGVLWQLRSCDTGDADDASKAPQQRRLQTVPCRRAQLLPPVSHASQQHQQCATATPLADSALPLTAVAAICVAQTSKRHRDFTAGGSDYQIHAHHTAMMPTAPVVQRRQACSPARAGASLRGPLGRHQD